MIDHLDKIWWEDSWLLGWERVDGDLTLFVDLHLLKHHPLFEPCGTKQDFGCYKTARLVIGGLQAVTGLPSDRHDLQWDEVMEEYKDVGDIDVIDIEEHGGRLAMEVGAMRAADSFRLEATGRLISLFFEEF